MLQNDLHNVKQRPVCLGVILGTWIYVYGNVIFLCKENYDSRIFAVLLLSRLTVTVSVSP